MKSLIIEDIFSQELLNDLNNVIQYFSNKCNIKFDYWQGEELNHRDELYLTFSALFLLHSVCKDDPIEEWRLKFDVAFLYHLKSIIETFITIDNAIKNNHYTVCYPLLRALHSKLCMVILCSFDPEIFDHWLKNQKNTIYFDTNIRKELLKHDLYVYNHFYKLYSSVTHGMHDGLARVGYLQNKFGEKNVSIENQIYIISKFLIGTYAFTEYTVLGLELNYNNKTKRRYENIKELFDFLEKKVLVSNRIDNISMIFPEEGYEEKYNGEYILAAKFSFKKYKELITQNYFNFPDSIILSKKYIRSK
jgi:hypothetical protein